MPTQMPSFPWLSPPEGWARFSHCHFLLTAHFRLVRFPPVVARGASFRQQRRQCPPGASEAKSGKASQSKKAATTSIRPYADLSAYGGRYSCRCGPDGGSPIGEAR
jgi:hypothetical protein